MSQKIEYIDVKKLVLWTENPRDPISANASDQDIVNKAWSDKGDKWQLLKLAKEMQSHYDYSELPTVVYHDKKPVVYDGNRRMILAKLKHDLVQIDDFDKQKLPDIPQIIPCNVCSEDIAIKNVYRKHAESGSWSPLERDIFLNKFMNEPKTIFLKLEEATGIITSNPHLNKVFVRDEIFTSEKLKEIGFEFKGKELKSKHSISDSKSILNDISNKVLLKTIDTRNNRGKVLDVLDQANRLKIEKNSNKQFNTIKFDTKGKQTIAQPAKRQAPRTKKKNDELFDGVLYLKQGPVSDLYRDISDLYKHYICYKDDFSQYFPSLIRMALRLLAESAAKDMNISLSTYIKNNFVAAKKSLDTNTKTTLSTQNVTENSIEQLLHIGAHNYTAAQNINQTIAVSIILGKILEITHGKQ